MLVLLLLIIIQIGMGTQVREAIDHIGKSSGGLDRSQWVAQLPFVFSVHRSFSWLLLAGSVTLIVRLVRKKRSSRSARWIVGLCMANILAGIGLAYFGMPPALQPLHLMLAVLLFGAVLRSLASERAWTLLRSA
jgi:cytochrome c oxidase assembly protein subunit 15